MSKTEESRARIDPSLKHEAENILEQVGVTASEAIRQLYRQIVNNNGIPYELRLPNRTTRKTLDDSAKGIGVKRFSNMDEMLEDLEK